MTDIETSLQIRCPILVNWDGDLFVAGREFFSQWRVKHERGRTVSFPQSTKGDRPLRWIISADASLFEFRPTEVVNKWAGPLRSIIRLVRTRGVFLPERDFNVAELKQLLSTVKPDNRDFHNRRDLLRIVTKLADGEQVTSLQMHQFFGEEGKDPPWPGQRRHPR